MSFFLILNIVMLRKSLPYLLRNPKNKEKRLILNFRINTNGRKGNLISIINWHCHSYFSVHFVYSLSLSLLLFKIQTLISSVSHRRFEIVSDFQSLSGWLLQLDLDLELLLLWSNLFSFVNFSWVCRWIGDLVLEVCILLCIW